MKPRVFLIEPIKHDITNAERFGRVTYLFEADEPRPNIWSKELCRQLWERLEIMHFRPEVDYLLVAGAMPAITQLLLLLGGKLDKINVLLFNAVTRSYDVLTYSQRAIECETEH